MLTRVLGQVDVWGGYVAIWKVVVFAVLFCVWAAVGQWVNRDAPVVHTNRSFWNNLYLGIGTVAAALWLVVPAPFWIAFLLFMVVWGTLTLTYVMHRNARVPRDLRVLTPEHVRGVLSRAPKEVTPRLTFVSSRGNELPVPSRREAEYQGWLIAEDLVYEMTAGRVSRAELRPGPEEYQVAYVIDGVPGRAGDRPRLEVERALVYLKEAAGLDVEERRRPQRGKFTVKIEMDEICWHVKTAGSTRGEQMVLEREEEGRLLRLGDLGFSKDQLEKMREVVSAPAGVVLVSGPAGSGVTTTLYGMIKEHDAFIQNINALELEAMQDIDNVTQNVVKESGDVDPARQLQSVLRTDPDVVMVGFTTTAEMAQVGTRGAHEGKKLYFGIQAPTAFHALQSWMKMMDDPRKAAKTLLAVTNQRLVRKLCPECREPYAPDRALLKKLNLPADKIKRFYRAGEVQYDKHGKALRCEKCQGMGYFDRMAIYETLIVSDGVRKLIAQNAPINAVRSQCRQEKMMFLQEQALRRVIDGTTSIQEVLRVTGQGGAPGTAASAQASPEGSGG